MQTLKLQTEITADYLPNVEQQLTEIFFRRLKSKNDLRRDGFFEKKIVPVLFIFIRVACIVLLLLVGLSLLLGTSVCNSLTLNIFMLLFASLFLFVFWDRNKLEGKLNGFNERVFAWVAKKRARLMVKQAAKLAPFRAEYDFRENVLAYYRIKNGVVSLVWHRTLTGFFLVGQGFILFYKSEKQSYPYAIILHEATVELETYLKAQSCFQIAN
ncbi:hypothetical protein GCM10011613_35660 [Cellvibrio zantedeschiae]|uniref:YcxB-like protein domain-containing protein n=1 Tax=Cellvibrio zantedeschiae TaxID=1237077 RepID=A0ABQ3BAA0_9GAMM|nr:hypothetical protein [Cellvibrio zantedeschiae]GGY87345.1 hypothetical protein GCM10011613_35660 [Cellvibrio zantedeschiae]